MTIVDTLRGRDFLRLQHFTRAELTGLLDLAVRLKAEQKAGRPHTRLAGKSLAMIFQKPSTRTRVSFEVGMYQLGGQALFLSGHDIQIGRGETVADTARVLSRMVDGIMIRTFAQSDLVQLAEQATVPVINGLTDAFHPCQVMADLQAVLEHKGRLEGLKLAYIGDGNNMAHSLLNGCAIVGMDVAVASPEGYSPDPAVVAEARAAQRPGGLVHICLDPEEAVQGADLVYTDVWASMGQEAEQGKRAQAFAGYQVTVALMRQARPDALFMHDLPAHRGEEVAAEVIDGPQSIVFDQAENRLHVQKAILATLMG